MLDLISYLDKYIIGQETAKKAIAVSIKERQLKNQMVEKGIRLPMGTNNILLKGPTGCGKTELVKRVAEFIDCPFIKVSATAFSETGYKGKDVESIIADLISVAENQKPKMKVETSASEKIPVELDEVGESIERFRGGKIADVPTETLRNVVSAMRKVPKNTKKIKSFATRVRSDVLAYPILILVFKEYTNLKTAQKISYRLQDACKTLSVFETQYKEGKLRKGDINFIARELRKLRTWDQTSMSDSVLDDFSSYMDKLLDYKPQAQIKNEGVRNRVENKGIVFIDEIDKLSTSKGDMVSRDGVQRGLLSLIEGSMVDGVSTENILFICAGAFQETGMDNLFDELLGRLPIKVEMKGLTEEDIHRILVETESSPVKIYKQLLGELGYQVTITKEAVKLIAKHTNKLNQKENYGVRQLDGVFHQLFQDYILKPGNGEKIVISGDVIYTTFGYRCPDKNKYVL